MPKAVGKNTTSPRRRLPEAFAELLRPTLDATLLADIAQRQALHDELELAWSRHHGRQKLSPTENEMAEQYLGLGRRIAGTPALTRAGVRAKMEAVLAEWKPEDKDDSVLTLPLRAIEDALRIGIFN